MTRTLGNVAPTPVRTLGLEPILKRIGELRRFLDLFLLLALGGCGEDSGMSESTTDTETADAADTSESVETTDAADTSDTDRQNTEPPDSLETGPGAFDPDYASSPGYFTRLSSPMDSRTHARQRTWYSANIMGLARSGPFSVPEGSVAIKAEYDDAGVNFLTVVMIKREAGYDPDGNDWYYEAREPDGTLAASPTPGPAALCSGCHGGASATDYLLAFDLEN